jgi:radical SAM protein with 4Fe4S-binding SPASM domain
MALRLYTNATRIDRKTAAAVAALRPLAVEVSLYATDAAGHDSVTQRRSLRRTLRGVVLLRRAGVRLTLKAPLLAVTAASAPALERWAARLGAGLRLDPLVRPRLDGNRAPIAHRASGDALAAGLASPGARLGPAAPPPDPSEAPCAIARRTVRIDADGNVYPCPSWPAPVGSLRERSFADIWAGGPLLDELRAVTVASERGACSGCGQRGECARCMATALVEHGDALGPSAEACRIGAAKPAARRRLRVV